MMMGKKLVATHCPYCSLCCGLYLSVGMTGKVEGIEPKPDFPINEGSLCPKGITSHEVIHHPDRLKTPLIRDEDQFRKASWSEALQRIASKFNQIIKEHGSQAIGCYAGSRLTNETIYLFNKFAHVAIGTNNVDSNDRLGTSSSETAYKTALGSDRASNPLSDLSSTELIILVGSNAASSHPVLIKYLFNAKDRGAKIIVIDPRRTQTANVADIHLQIRPGTDLALLNGMLNLMITNGLIDRNFISEKTKGFEDVEDAVSKYTLRQVAGITGLSEEQIVDAARLYGRARSAMILHSRGIEQQVNGVANIWGCINLALATGKIGRLGSGCLSILGHVRGQGGVVSNDAASNQKAAQSGSVGLSAVEMVEAAAKGELKAMYVLASNPLVSMPDLSFVKDAFKRLKFLVVQDIFPTETSNLAHVILPGSIWAESEGTISCVDGRYVKLNKAVNPPNEALEDWRIICRVADSLDAGKHFQYGSVEDVFNGMKSASEGSFLSYSGLSYRRLTETDGVFLPCPSEDSPEMPRLYEEKFAGEDGFAVFHPVEYLPSTEQPSEAHPFTLTTCKTQFQFLTGTQSMRVKFFKEMCPSAYVEINPEAAGKLGISNGDFVLVKSARGEVKLKAEVTDTIREDCVAMPFHWGDAAAANLLTSRTLNPLSKIPGYKFSCVSVRKG